jgi:gliding motility-associated-like protein
MLFSVVGFIAKADHITGGEMFYSYSGIVNGQHVYNVTLKLFMRCQSGRMFPDPIIISSFDKSTNSRVQDYSIPIGQRETIRLVNHDPCITNPPEVCYEVAYYFATVALPATTSGYILSSQVNYRIRGISNLDGSQVGATYSCEIPGTSPLADANLNQSAVFVGSDLVEVCANSYFTYSFAAQNPDGDNIRYSFCAAYASTSGGVAGIPPGNPPYPSVPYWSGFSESAPLGGRVNIDPTTGLIAGVAPAAGVYVVTVCAEEIRNGTVIATQRKDIQISVADCSVAGAVLPSDYMLCGTSTRLQASNLVNSPLIVAWNWTIFNAAGTQIHASTGPGLDYTFGPPNGVYSVRLIVNQGQPCSDTATAPVYVFPGLAPDFEAAGICFTKSTTITDKSTVVSGAINSWSWDFGEPSTTADVSTQQNNVYTYPTMGVKNISLMVTTTDGCRDTLVKQTTIVDKPPITLGFRDTLICVNDRVQLQASGTGNFTWTPAVNIINANSGTPTVFPNVTTQYFVELETDGCRNQSSVMVRVVDHVSLRVMADTTICRGDTIRLRIVSDGLQYSWSPASQVMNPVAPNPFVITHDPTRYDVIARIGGCTAPGSITVNTVPYPLAFAGADTTICNKSSAFLHGVTNADKWTWGPAPTLTSATSLHTVANPTASVTTYILTVSDSRSECNKSSRDTMVVTMLPKIFPSAGRDTAVIINQPLQLHASGGDRYEWSPWNFLSNPHIPDPLAVYGEATTGIRYKVTVYNKAECWDTASILVKVFSTLPTVFVPSGFTPNNDGLNDVLKPIAVGMKQIETFSIFNRWGDLVFTTKINGHGWDGRINGRDQGSNTYVWFVKAVDYTGKAYFHKGTVTLIR